jgi:hypothetical protein
LCANYCLYNERNSELYTDGCANKQQPDMQWWHGRPYCKSGWQHNYLFMERAEPFVFNGSEPNGYANSYKRLFIDCNKRYRGIRLRA